MTDLFDESFIEQLPSVPLEALNTMITLANQHIGGTKDKDAKFELAAQAYAPEFAPQLETNLSPNNKEHSVNVVASSFASILQLIENEQASQSVQSFEERAKALIRKVDVIEFTDGDFNRLQELINEMREIATQTEELGERHRRRILERLEKLQAEVHKRVTKIDEAWLLLPEIGLALGRFGKNAAPMWDRLNETLRIVAGAEARRAELPSSYEPPFLPKPELDEDSGADDPQEPDSTPPT